MDHGGNSLIRHDASSIDDESFSKTLYSNQRRNLARLAAMKGNYPEGGSLFCRMKSSPLVILAWCVGQSSICKPCERKWAVPLSRMTGVSAVKAEFCPSTHHRGNFKA